MSAINSAVVLLQDKKSECAKIFGAPTSTYGKKYSPDQLLQSIAGLFEMNYKPGFPFQAITDVQPDTFLGVVTGVKGTIKVNASLANDYVELTLTIIHELGHVLRVIGWSGGDFEDTDSFSHQDAQTKNNKTIKEKCL